MHVLTDAFFFNDTATTEIYTLSLHDALPISTKGRYGVRAMVDLAINYGESPMSIKSIAKRQNISELYLEQLFSQLRKAKLIKDRKSTRLNSSHANISYAVFCLKKKKRCM